MTRTWHCVSAVCPLFGKQEHIVWLITELFNARQAIVRSQEILLLDDDNDNITKAIEFGHHAYHVLDTVTMVDLKEFIDTITVHSTKYFPVIQPKSTRNGTKSTDERSNGDKERPIKSSHKEDKMTDKQTVKPCTQL